MIRSILSLFECGVQSISFQFICVEHIFPTSLNKQSVMKFNSHFFSFCFCFVWFVPINWIEGVLSVLSIQLECEVIFNYMNNIHNRYRICTWWRRWHTNVEFLFAMIAYTIYVIFQWVDGRWDNLSHRSFWEWKHYFSPYFGSFFYH